MSNNQSDDTLLNLPEAQQAKLAEWLLGGIPYHEAKLLVEIEFGVVRSLDCFSDFWSAFCRPLLSQRRNQMRATAEDRAEAADKEPARFDSATLDALKQKAFELAQAPNANLKDLKVVMTLLLKARDQDLQRDFLALAQSKYRDLVEEKKAAIARELSKAKSSGGISAKTLKKIEAELKLF